MFLDVSPELTIETSIVVSGDSRASGFLAMGPGLDILTRSDDTSSRMPTYPGGKNGAGVYQKIINLMPPHDVYIEPFLGGGAVMRLKRPADQSFGIDLSRDAIANFRDSSGSIFRFDDGDQPRAGIARFSERRRSPKTARVD